MSFSHPTLLDMKDAALELQWRRCNHCGAEQGIHAAEAR